MPEMIEEIFPQCPKTLALLTTRLWLDPNLICGELSGQHRKISKKYINKKQVVFWIKLKLD